MSYSVITCDQYPPSNAQSVASGQTCSIRVRRTLNWTDTVRKCSQGDAGTAVYESFSLTSGLSVLGVMGCREMKKMRGKTIKARTTPSTRRLDTAGAGIRWKAAC